jgi:hypothetical protein
MKRIMSYHASRRAGDMGVRPCLRSLAIEDLEKRNLLAVSVLSSSAGLALADTPWAGTAMGEFAPPPDAHLSVGTTHVVEVTNSSIGIFDKKTGEKISVSSLSDFFSSVGASAPKTIGDPRTAYDELSGRHIIVTLDTDVALEESILLLAVSHSSDPTKGWEKHAIDVEDGGATKGDYPGLGWDADGIYVTLNMFTWPSIAGSFVFDHVSVLAIEKSSVLDEDDSTLSFTDTDLAGASYFTMQPAIMHGVAAGAPMYFVYTTVTEATGAGDLIHVAKMTDKISATPTFESFDITVDPYLAPPNAAQPFAFPLATTDGRIMNAAWRGGRLVASQTVGTTTGEAHARWYEISTAEATLTLTQAGEISGGPTVSTYFPAIEIAANGDLGMTYLESSPTEFVSMYVTGRKDSDPLGTMTTGALVKAGEAPFIGSVVIVTPFGPAYVAGDYSGIAVDPAPSRSAGKLPIKVVDHLVATLKVAALSHIAPLASGKFWAANEYSVFDTPVHSWGTWISSFIVTASTAASGAVAAEPLTASTGNATPDLLAAQCVDAVLAAMLAEEADAKWSAAQDFHTLSNAAQSLSGPASELSRTPAIVEPQFPAPPTITSSPVLAKPKQPTKPTPEDLFQLDE